MVKALRPTLKGFTIIELLVVLVLFAIIIVPFADAVNNAKFSARSASCRSNMREIGKAALLYAATHKDELPRNITSLIRVAKYKSLFLCPESGYFYSDDGSTYIKCSYTYRYVSHARNSDIICWDSIPHTPQHSVFVWLNRKNRSVLYADGRVATLSEDKFQKLKMQGSNVVLEEWSATKGDIIAW